MPADHIITLARITLENTLWLAAPILIVTLVVGLTMSILQTMTSIQEQSLSTVPRLLSVGATTFIMMPGFSRNCRTSRCSCYQISTLIFASARRGSHGSGSLGSR
jgi:flagellar biosynthetic protein FliQ